MYPIYKLTKLIKKMKKTLFGLAALALSAMVFVACDNKKDAQENCCPDGECCPTGECCPADSSATEEELITVDTTVIDTTANGVVNVENVVTATPETAQ